VIVFSVVPSDASRVGVIPVSVITSFWLRQ
jgi:hypothetical protein